MDSSDISAQVATSAMTSAMSFVVSFLLEQATGAIGAPGMVACVAVGAIAGFLGFQFGYGRGASSPNPPRPSRRAVKGFSKAKARAVLAANESDSMIKVGKHSDTVWLSAMQNEGVFLASGTQINGNPGQIEEFTITDQWRAFLRKPMNKRAVELIAE